MDAVDRNPVAAQLHRQGLSEVHQGTIAGPATEVPGVAGVGATDVDDAAPPLRLQVGDYSPGAAQCPHILHVEVMQQILVDDGFNGTSSRSRASGWGTAVHQNVQAA